jgi:hypothetical protein
LYHNSDDKYGMHVSFLVFANIMLFTAARAYIVRSTTVRQPFVGLMGRPMSAGSPSDADISVVATCARKIQAALETSNVKVTGAFSFFAIFVCLQK